MHASAHFVLPAIGGGLSMSIILPGLLSSQPLPAARIYCSPYFAPVTKPVKEVKEQMRLFVGISPTEEIRKSLVKMQKYLDRHGVTGTFMESENLHMTLAFIGEYPEADSVLDAMEEVSFEPFTIVLDHLGTFRQSIVWGGITPSEQLEKTVRKLRHSLAKAGIPFDNASFTPHFTLARHADFSKGIPPVDIPPVSMSVDQLTLYRSDRGKNGMIYTPIGVVDHSP